MSIVNQCGVAALVVAGLLLAILLLLSGEKASSESYTGGCVAFPDPDYGQYSYAGCRCSRVGEMMNNGIRSSVNDSGLYSAQFNRAYQGKVPRRAE